MSAVDEIQAAIEKLTKLKSHGSDGRWGFHQSSGIAAITNEIGRGVAHHVPAPDAALIVTLHATIDAQLAILNFAAKNYWEPGSAPEDWESFDESRAILSLATAINGATS